MASTIGIVCLIGTPTALLIHEHDQRIRAEASFQAVDAAYRALRHADSLAADSSAKALAQAQAATDTLTAKAANLSARLRIAIARAAQIETVTVAGVTHIDTVFHTDTLTIRQLVFRADSLDKACTDERAGFTHERAACQQAQATLQRGWTNAKQEIAALQARPERSCVNVSAWSAVVGGLIGVAGTAWLQKR